MEQPRWTLGDRCQAEFFGTFVLVFFGCGAVHVAVLTGALCGLWQVAIVWAVAIMLAVYVFGGISGAHINPAITIALALWGRFAWRDVLLYVVAQLLGAFIAAAVLHLLFQGMLRQREEAWEVQRGERGSQITAMCYGEFFPNPGLLKGEPKLDNQGKKTDRMVYTAHEHATLETTVSEPIACVAEFVGTALLALVVFAATDPRNAGGPAEKFAPVFIGLTVAVLIVVIAPLTQACFNPARDVGPRLFAAIAGWGTAAFPRGTGMVTVYIASPILGACAGGALSNYLWRKVPTSRSS